MVRSKCSNKYLPKLATNACSVAWQHSTITGKLFGFYLISLNEIISHSNLMELHSQALNNYDWLFYVLVFFLFSLFGFFALIVVGLLAGWFSLYVRSISPFKSENWELDSNFNWINMMLCSALKPKLFIFHICWRWAHVLDSTTTAIQIRAISEILQ